MRTLLKFICTFLGIVLVLMLCVTVYVGHLLGQINYIQDSSPMLSQEQLDAYLSEMLSGETGNGGAELDPEDVDFDDHNTTIGGKGSGIVNILLIGQDRRAGEERARSDSMILCTFNKKAGTLTLTSFLRDLYVSIPGYQSNRINVAYAAGGMTLLNDTLEKNFGIHVDGNVEVDFTRFAELIDLLGGVTMELRQDEANQINRDTGSSLSAGTQWLTGTQALAYARIRNLDADGDFSRTNRQRKVVNALLESYKDADLKSILSLLSEALPMISTDLSEGKIISYALELFPMLAGAEFVSQRIPADGTYQGRMINGMAVLVADMDASRQILEETLLGN